MISRRKFIAGAAALGALAGIGAKPKEKKTMAFTLVEKGAGLYLGNGAVTFSNSPVVGASCIPAGEIWDITNVYAKFNTSATPGNRVFVIELTSGSLSGNSAEEIWVPAVSIASKTIVLQARQHIPSAITSAFYAGGAYIDYQVPFDHVCLNGVAGNGSVYAQDFAGIDIGADTVALLITFDRYQFTSDASQQPIVHAIPERIRDPNI